MSEDILLERALPTSSKLTFGIFLLADSITLNPAATLFVHETKFKKGVFCLSEKSEMSRVTDIGTRWQGY